jgi:hypothetical protein
VIKRTPNRRQSTCGNQTHIKNQSTPGKIDTKSITYFQQSRSQPKGCKANGRQKSTSYNIINSEKLPNILEDKEKSLQRGETKEGYHSKTQVPERNSVDNRRDLHNQERKTSSSKVTDPRTMSRINNPEQKPSRACSDRL